MPQEHNAESKSTQRKAVKKVGGAGTQEAPRSPKEFCTSLHRFAQVFSTNLIDGEKRKVYFAFQIEPGSLRTLRINLRGAANLTVVAPRDWIAKLEALAVSYGGCDLA